MTLGNFQFWKDVASQLRTSVPFVSEALNVLPLIDTRKVPYAATDNRSIMVNTKSWEEMEERCVARGEFYPNPQSAAATVLLHECLHVILKHKQRSVGHLRKNKFGQATAIFVNNTLVDIFTLPPFSYTGEKMAQYKRALAASGTFDERFRGKDTDQIYTTLCEEDPERVSEEPPPPSESETPDNSPEDDEDGDEGGSEEGQEESNEQDSDADGDEEDEQDPDGSGAADDSED